MKDARTYERKVKKLLTGARKKRTAAAPPGPDGPVRTLIEAILLADATPKNVEKAMAAIEKEFVDFNELRVAPEKDIVECIEKNYPDGRTKAHILTTVLNGLFDRTSTLGMEYLSEMSKRDIRRHLQELGLPPFSEAVVSMTCFGAHAVPVDQSLFEVMHMHKLVHDASDVADTQAFLERIVAQKDGPAVHAFFRDFVVKNAKALGKKRKEDAERKAAEEEARREAAQAAQRAEEKAAARQAEKKTQTEAARKPGKKSAAKKKKAPAKKKAAKRKKSKARKR